MLKILDFFLDKQKSFIPKKILSVPCTMDSSFLANRWRLDVLTFLIKGFGPVNTKSTAAVSQPQYTMFRVEMLSFINKTEKPFSPMLPEQLNIEFPYNRQATTSGPKPEPSPELTLMIWKTKKQLKGLISRDCHLLSGSRKISSLSVSGINRITKTISLEIKSYLF